VVQLLGAGHPLFNKGWQYFCFQFFLVANEIIINNEETATPAMLIEGIQF